MDAFLIGLTLACTILVILAYRVFYLNFLKDSFVYRQSPIEKLDNDLSTYKSIEGYGQIKIENSELNIGLGRKGYFQLEQECNLDDANIIFPPIYNRYTDYDFNFVSKGYANKNSSDLVSVSINILFRQLQFKHVNELSIRIKERDIVSIYMVFQLADAQLNIDDVFVLYQKYIQSLLDKGCQHFFELYEARYDKTECISVFFEQPYLCIAPEVLNVEAFKSALQTPDFFCIETKFYLDEMVFRIDFYKDYSIKLDAYMGADLESDLTCIPEQEYEFLRLSMQERLLKIDQYKEEQSLIRFENEEKARLKGYRINETYIDPF